MVCRIRGRRVLWCMWNVECVGVLCVAEMMLVSMDDEVSVEESS